MRTAKTVAFFPRPGSLVQPHPGFAALRQAGVSAKPLAAARRRRRVGRRLCTNRDRSTVRLGGRAVGFENVSDGKVTVIRAPPAETVPQLANQTIRVNVAKNLESLKEHKRGAIEKIMRRLLGGGASNWGYQKRAAIEIFARKHAMTLAIAQGKGGGGGYIRKGRPEIRRDQGPSI